MLRAVFQRNPRPAEDKSSLVVNFILFSNSIQCLAFLSQDFQVSATRWQASLGIGCMETPDFLLNSSFYAPDNGDEMEVGVLVSVSVLVSVLVSVSTIISLLHPPLSMEVTSSHNTHPIFPFHSPKPITSAGFMMPLNSNTTLSPFLWEHVTG